MSVPFRDDDSPHFQKRKVGPSVMEDLAFHHGGLDLPSRVHSAIALEFK
jgi:hypothetical protein